MPLADYERTPRDVLLDQAESRIVGLFLYVLVTAALGFGAGYLVGWLIMRGPLRFLATHRWVYQILGSISKKRSRYVSASVMTTAATKDDRVMMYRGHVEELYLTPDGSFSYIVLHNCFRYYTRHGEPAYDTGLRVHLGGPAADHETWDFFVITGAIISNVVFETSPVIRRTSSGERALDDAIRRLEAAAPADHTDDVTHTG
jgi:hypothetical protein